MTTQKENCCLNKNKELEGLKREISDLYYEITQFWRTAEQQEQTNKEINRIAKILKTKFKLNNWEY